jgi:hypothetical protein
MLRPRRSPADMIEAIELESFLRSTQRDDNEIISEIEAKEKSDDEFKHCKYCGRPKRSPHSMIVTCKCLM